MPPSRLDAFTIDALDGELRGAELRLRGKVRTSGAQVALERELTRIHDLVVEKCFPVFAVDVRELTFVNSSAIRLFVTWVTVAQRTGYKLVFLTERSVTWHRLSFAVLQSLAPDTVEIREGSSSGEAAP
jgi:hypothetical protein